MQSLGERLYIQQGNRAAQKALEKEREEANRFFAQAAKVKEQLRDINNLIFNLTNKLVEAIEHGDEPVRKVANWEHQNWLREAARGKAPHNQNLWDDWVRELEKEELCVVLEEAHDDEDMQYWINVRFEPHFFIDTHVPADRLCFKHDVV